MSRKRTKRTVRRICYVIAAVVVLLGIANYARPLPSIAADPVTVSGTTGTVTLKWPTDGTSAAIGAKGYGALSTQADLQLPTASLAKLITALTVLNAKPLSLGQQGPTITITTQDVAIYNDYIAQDGSVVPVQAGEQLNEYQALEAMMLPSANNIADTLAIWAFGSLANYTTAGTQEVKSLGLTHTTIGTDASGLSPTTTSSPSDLITIGSAVMSNPVLAQIVDQPSVVLPVAGKVNNVNTLLGHDGINGVKTGNSDQAGGNYLFSVPYSVGGHSITIIGTILHAPDLQDALGDSLPLLTSAEQDFTLEEPVTAGEKLGTYVTPWGEKVIAVAKKDFGITAWRGTTLAPTLQMNALTHTMPAGSQVGTITFSSGTYKVSEPIVLGQAYRPPSVWWRVTRH